MNLIDEKGTKTIGKLGIVVSRFNEEVTSKLLEGAIARARDRDIPDQNITVAWVPGAIEVPLMAQRLAQLGKYDAIVCLGAVIRGETGHYDYVCEQVSQGCQTVALQNDIPVIFGVLTTENEEQAMARSSRGRDAIDAALEMIAALKKV